MSELSDRPTWSEQVTVANILAVPRFNELVEGAAETCLTDPTAVDRYKAEIAQSRQESSEGALIQKLGLWGICTAFNILNCKEPLVISQGIPAGSGEEMAINKGLRSPERFTGRTDPSVQTTIEAFGKALLDEAFSSLGDDAESKVEEFRNAPTAKEQRKVCRWLTERLAGSDDVDDDEVIKKDWFYHPIRLSPKFIGQFPDVTLPPTCLGVSVFAASFFEKAGATYVHAGIAESSGTAARKRYELALELTTLFAHRDGLELPDMVLQKYRDISAQTRKDRLEDHGYHAAVVVRLVDGSWLQVDPYSGVNAPIMGNAQETIYENENGGSNDRETPHLGINKPVTMDSVYNDLEILSVLDPSAELMFQDTLHEPSIYIMNALIESYNKSASLDEIDTYLQAAEIITFKGLAEKFIAPLFFGEPPNPATQAMQDQVKAYFAGIAKVERPDGTDLLEELMVEVLQKYTFPGAKDGNLDKSLARCKIDTVYRSRRAEDLKLAPIHFMARAIGEMTNLSIKYGFEHHTRLELGQPRRRIGACVLSDFAVYTGDEMPPSFWLSHWPSVISLTEHLPSADDANTRILPYNVAALVANTNLQYTKSHSIIKEFLGITRSQGEETT